MHASSNSLRIRFWPDWRNANPYQRLFYAALEPYGVKAEPGIEFSPAWLEENQNNIDMIHIHWPEGIWRRYGLNAWKEPLHLLRLKNYLKMANALGIGVMWTVHNLVDHEGGRLADCFGYRSLLKHSDLSIVHSESVAEQIEKERGKDSRRIVVMQHGNYVDCYPAPNNRQEVLKYYGLRKDIPVAACLGHIREYKGIDIAIDAINIIDNRVQLIIAGRPYESFDIRNITKKIKALPFSLLLPRMLSSQEFADLSRACDVILLPYRRITSSGALLSAWTFGRCAVTSDLPFFREAAKQYPGAVKLFKTGSVESLAKTIKGHFSQPNKSLNDAALIACEATSWSNVIVPVAEALGCIR